MMDCEICLSLKASYATAVSELHTANEHLRRAKAGSLDAALSRREVHHSLSGLIAAETELRSHKAWHLQCMTMAPVMAEHAATL